MQSLRRLLLLVALVFGAQAVGGLAIGPSAAATVKAVGAIGMTVADLDRSVAFYRDVLTFRPVEEREVSGGEAERLYGVFGVLVRSALLALGDERIELVQFLAPEGRPFPPGSRSNDGWFQHIAIVVSDIDSAYARLRDAKVRHASPGPQRLPDWNPAAGGISAFYFRDPDGHFLEIIHFPEGKGLARWHNPGAALFLGIDHTAIVTADTTRSLGFYRDGLGLDLAGRSENWGPEQERLNNVFGARLRITTLRAAAGPGVELLEYLSPPGGRPMPGDTQANDLWHWQVHLVVDDAARSLEDAVRGGGRRVSSTYEPQTMIRDPDGHAVMLGASAD